ncbi:hypothetical protein EC973_007096 [Apophysomyces ossiformis]|uniref:SH3 domain-containing protein n=1 Tax=Apophysomyces ossiformis TaxID=679940 RepID=A0A8H7BT40_9FUNG|nr:hypothetical protein EC973_007096 [Apophysomyces ossiformis]
MSWSSSINGLSLLLLLLSLSLPQFAKTEPVQPPVLKQAALGQLGFLGEYAGISPYKSATQFESINPVVSSIILQDDDNIYNLIASVNGNITTTCYLSHDDTADIYLAGSFTLLNNTLVNNIARFDTRTRTFATLDRGLNGSVYALFCDSASQTVYAGGDFTAPIGLADDILQAFGQGAAVWQNGNWHPVPWKGFNGPVYTIAQNSKRHTILFGGRFDATGDGQYYNANSSQPVNMGQPTVISSGNSALTGNYSDPNNIVCPNSTPQSSGKPWLLENNLPGYWEAAFAYPIQPSLFRLSNARFEGRGTGTFGIIAMGSNEYFQLSYIDPITQQITMCSENCTLSNDEQIAYQDFTVMNPITTSGVRIYINSWYGAGGGLGNVQIFQSAQGQYSVYTNTPGCVGSSSCDERVQIELFMEFSPGNSTSVVVDQKVTEDRTTLIYSGFISSTSATFQPKVILRTASNSTLPASNTVSIVADSLQFIRNGTGSTLISILEYSPYNMTRNIQPAWRPLAQQLMPGAIVSSIEAAAGDILYIGGQFIGANNSYRNVVSFDYNTDGGRLVALSNSGIEGNVTALKQVGSKLFVGGAFNRTVAENGLSLNNVACYNIEQQTWSSLEKGIDGPVENIMVSSANNTVTFSGTMKHVLLDSGAGQAAVGNAIWDVDTNEWTNRRSLVVGSLVSTYQIDTKTSVLTGRMIGAQTYRADGAATLDTQNIWSPYLFNGSEYGVINTGLFWHDTSMGQNKTVIVVGGRFQIGNISNLAMYKDGSWHGIGNLQGEVKALAVLNNQLYIGGQFTGSLLTSKPESFAIYDLAENSSIDVVGVHDTNHQPGLINVIKIQDDGQRVYIGGNFSSVGSLDCGSVCAFDTRTRQWDRVAQGLDGTVYALTVTGDRILAMGDLNINGQAAYIAQLNSRGVWATSLAGNAGVKGIPTAALDAPGQTIIAGSNGTSAYLGMWDGQSYTSLGSKLGPLSEISQLLFVPLDSASNDFSLHQFPAHSGDILLVMGSLNIEPFGNVSAALFDGTSWYPYVLATKIDGMPGSIRQIFHESACCTVIDINRYLPVPAVILISIAISLGLIFALIATGFLIIYIRRRYTQEDVPEAMPPWVPNREASSLIAMLDAAQVGALGVADEMKEKGHASSITSPGHPDSVLDMADHHLGYLGAVTPVAFGPLLAAAVSGRNAGVASEENPHLYYAKYAFEAKEYGELGFDANEAIVVIDTSDSVWWMGYKDNGQGTAMSGLFPSNYVTDTKYT